MRCHHTIFNFPNGQAPGICALLACIITGMCYKFKTEMHISVFRKARDISYMQRVQSRYATSLGVKANKLQKHFRPQINF
jgi:hypothetical protein